MSFRGLLRPILLAALTFTGLAGEAIPAEVEMRVDARPLDEPIQVHVLVEEAGTPLAGLSAGDFAVTLDGQTISEIALTRPRSLGADVQTSVAIVTGFAFALDVASGSYENLIRRLRAGDQAAIVRFRYRPNGETTHLYMSTLPFKEMDGDANTAEAIEFLGMNPEYYASWSWGSDGAVARDACNRRVRGSRVNASCGAKGAHRRDRAPHE